jgi:hypothetical protein
MTGHHLLFSRSLSFRRGLAIVAAAVFISIITLNILNFQLSTPRTLGLNLQFSRQRNSSSTSDTHQQKVLVLTLIRDHDSWGAGRSFKDFLKLVQGLDYPMSNVTIGILASDKREFKTITKYVNQLSEMEDSFSQIHVLLREKDVGISRDDRKEDEVQRERRRLIARLRNYLLYSTLRDEDYVLWIDSDMIQIPDYLLKTMIRSGKDIITVATRLGPEGGFYDLNAWVGERITPNEEEQKIIEQGGIFVPRPESVRFTHELEEEYSPLDSVGGTVLFVRSEVHREGVAFTTNYVIGTGWKHEGYDGIESEGLCYVAGFLGYKCWGMPHAIAVHSDQ